ncbi:MAG: hypothetical protein WBQ09_03935 [Terriglobales bacterium]
MPQYGRCPNVGTALQASCPDLGTASHPEIIEARDELEKANAMVRLAKLDLYVPDVWTPLLVTAIKTTFHF